MQVSVFRLSLELGGSHFSTGDMMNIYFSSLLVLLTLLYCSSVQAQQDKTVTPNVTRLTDAEAAAFLKQRADRKDLTDPSEQYVQALRKLSLSYDVEYQALSRSAERFHVYSSPGTFLLEWPEKLILAVSKENGGFALAKSSDPEQYSIMSLLPANQLVDNPQIQYDFEATAGVAGRGIHLFGQDGSTSIQYLHELTSSPQVRVLSREQDKGGLLKIKYEAKRGDSISGSTDTSGTVTVDQNLHCLIRDLEVMISNGKTNINSTRSYTYYPPSSEIPYPLVKECVAKDRFSGASSSTIPIKMIFSNYKIGIPPAEKLKLSYYIHNAPDELIAPTRSRWQYYLVTGVLALVGIGVWMARRKRTTGA